MISKKQDLIRMGVILLLILSSVIWAVAVLHGWIGRMEIREHENLFLDAAREKKGVRVKGKEIYLAPGASFEFEKTLPKPPGSIVNIQAWFYSDGNLENSIEIRGNDRLLLESRNTPHLEYPSLVLDSPEAMKSRKLNIRITAHNTGDLDRLVLTRFRARFIQNVPIPSIPDLFAAFSLVAFLFMFLWETRDKTVCAIAAIALISGVAAFARGILPQFVLLLIPAGVAAGIYASRNKKLDVSEQRLFLLLGLWILLIGIVFRWKQLAAVRYLPLDSDTLAFLDIADRMKGLWDTSFREPGYIWLIKAWTGLFGNHPMSVRLFTSFLSLLVLPLVFFVGWKGFGRVVALLAGFMMATNANLVFNAVRGYRHELFILLLFSFLYLVYHGKALEKTRGGLIPGILAGFLVLSNLSFLWLFLFLVTAWIIIHRDQWKAAFLCIGVMFIMIMPYLVKNRMEYGQAMYPMNVHARFYRNLEMSRMGGEEWAAFLASPYSGESVTLDSYLFEDHTPLDILGGMIRGGGKIYGGDLLNDYLFGGSLLLRLFYIIGIIVMVTVKRYRWWLLAFFSMNYMCLWIASLGIEWRLVSHYSPLVYFICFTGLGYLVDKIGKVQPQGDKH